MILSNMIKIRTLAAIILSATFSQWASAQTKVEREYRIKKNAVPENALTFIEECFPGSTVKWYREENTKGSFIEAKTIQSKTKYSIKFDSQGNLQDTEQIVSFESLPSEARDKIGDFLKTRFTKYRIVKIQKQWLAAETTIKSLITTGKSDTRYETNFELEVRGTKGKDIDFFEFLFNENGKLLKEYEIVQKNTNNLIF